ncbi:MAG: hypothetical protein J0M08_11135 [Bacteroidetes bacterium]|nr:hypothetical protein [Bacteroidota bacterium]
MYKHLITLFFCLLSFFSQSQPSTSLETKTKGTFYFSWGYTRATYSKSNLHFKDDGSDKYDFVLKNVAAEDKSDFENMLNKPLTVPQYVYRVGYFFNDKYNLGIEINFDHTKYVIKDNQTLHLEGTIRGSYFNQDTLVDRDFLLFEHTDGANFLMVNGIKRFDFLSSKNKKFAINGIVKYGLGMVIPKTNVTLFGNKLDNKFHIAGIVTGPEAGLRFTAFNYFFVETVGKITFANYMDVLVIGTGKAHHSFWTSQATLTAGFQF